MGSNQRDIVAKVFGGGEVLTYENLNFNIGKKNIEAALDFICDHEIRIISKSVGGILGRKIIFNTLTGIVTHKYLASSEFHQQIITPEIARTTSILFTRQLSWAH